ncbi:MAG TPA: preprotein translocase subunit YajC [bacterium]|nr:preprotein translocase subunit YajC [bacterium]HPN32976.1 preprotein translocase subunit YajC [bacterium]
MNTFLSVFAMAGPSGGQQGGGSAMGMLLPIILMFVIMYFLLFRPQAKKQKEMRKMLESLQSGDQIMTIGGIFGTIVGFDKKDQIAIVKIADNVKIRVTRSSIARKVTSEETGN